jgi:S-adenosylmethionine-dependent methyltransferase
MYRLKRIIKKLLFLHEYSADKKLGIRYHLPDEKEFERLRQSLVENYFSNFPPPFPVEYREELEKGFIWMNDHLHLRLEAFRQKYVPFINSVRSLKGSTVLDVGCGTGASLVAFAEAGAKVYGIDIDAGSLKVAQTRSEIYGVEADTALLPASEINTFKPGVEFDFIIFNASLEHMFLHERLTSLKSAWDRLEPNGYLCIIECPNRLWYFDYHTSELPFFEWLPHDLALLYTRFSPRKYINELYKLSTGSQNMENFLRIGRGMSYHEIDLSIGDSSKLKMKQSLSNFIYLNSNRLERRRLMKRSEPFYSKFIREKSGKNLHEGFFEPWLNFIIEK